MNQQYKPRILVVDDEPDIVQILFYRLKSFGDYEVDTAYDGYHAARQVSEHAYDLILLDIMMPGIDGIQVCRSFRQRPETESVPIIIVSALGDSTHVMQALEAGANDYVVKPFTQEVLKSKVQQYLADHSYRHTVLEDEEVQFEDLKEALLPSTIDVKQDILEKIQNGYELPIFSETLLQIDRDIRASSHNLIKLIAADIGFSLDVLKVANSVFYSAKEPVTDIRQAVNVIGQDTLVSTIKRIIKSSILLSDHARQYLADGFFGAYYARALSIRMIAEHERYGVSFEAYTAGIVAYTGELFIMQEYPDIYDRILDEVADNTKRLARVQKQYLGYSADEISYRLLRYWRLPERLRNFVRYRADIERAGIARSDPKVVLLHKYTLLADYCARILGYVYGEKDVLPDPPSILKSGYQQFHQYIHNLLDSLQQDVTAMEKLLGLPKAGAIIPSFTENATVLVLAERPYHLTWCILLRMMGLRTVHLEWENLRKLDNTAQYVFIVADATDMDIASLVSDKTKSWDYEGILCDRDLSNREFADRVFPHLRYLKKPVSRTHFYTLITEYIKK